MIKQGAEATLVEEICGKLGVSEATFYRWKKQLAGMGVVEIRRLKQLEQENAKLKRLVADLSLDKSMLQDVLRKKVLRPVVRRDLVAHRPGQDHDNHELTLRPDHPLGGRPLRRLLLLTVF